MTACGCAALRVYSRVSASSSPVSRVAVPLIRRTAASLVFTPLRLSCARGSDAAAASCVGTAYQRRHLGFRMATPLTNCAGPLEKDGSKDRSEAEWRRVLSAWQYRVLREGATDPVGGKYDELFDDGEYVCAGCETPLYLSSMKFACGCGWPGFYDCIPRRVREQPDRDGRRAEIVCNACNGHLGHVFRNEGFRNPPPNERHCVNNTSVVFRPAQRAS
ncbi:SelR domain containing protein [Novymonas esmeraldas]|uniref:SelR domain containing protein n=1 Tax=Novymonas esmeraldas TaxID=1808958 RepID=A0AAW0EPB2_9TRYP